jgi:hypothetical protein
MEVVMWKGRSEVKTTTKMPWKEAPRLPFGVNARLSTEHERTTNLLQRQIEREHSIMAPTSDAEKEERLKAALWYSVGQTIDSIAVSKDINATPHFIGALSEMLWAQIGSKA